MKRCATCGELKPESEYNWRNKLKAKRWGTCRDCQNGQKRRRYEKNKATHKTNVYARKQDKVEEARRFIWEHLSTHPCVGDGVNPCPSRETDPVVLEFDHVRGKKAYTVSKMVADGYLVESIKKEIAKCVVRCRNCHIRKTHREQRSWRHR